MDLLQAVLPTILQGLTQPELAPSAALAFRDVCGECAEKLVPYMMQLIPACEVGGSCRGVACGRHRSVTRPTCNILRHVM